MIAKASPELYLGTIPGRVSSGRSHSGNKAISVQLQLQLPTGTELGNMLVHYFKDGSNKHFEEKQKETALNVRL